MPTNPYHDLTSAARSVRTSEVAMQFIGALMYLFAVGLTAVAFWAVFNPQHAHAAASFAQPNATVQSANPIPNTLTQFFTWTPSTSGTYDGHPWVYMSGTGGFGLCGLEVWLNGVQASTNLSLSTFITTGWVEFAAGAAVPYNAADTIDVYLNCGGATHELYGQAAVVAGTATSNFAADLGTPAIALGGTAPPTVATLNGTGVSLIITPVLGATTTSPVSISFEYTISSSSMPYEDDRAFSQYRLQFTQPSTGRVVNAFGTLSNVAFGSFTESTSTALTGDGTWELSIGLTTVGEFGARAYAPVGQHTFFGLGFNDRPDVYSQYLPPQQSAYSSSSCQVSFVGTFDLTQCLGYLIVPTVGSTSPLNNIRNLSLKNSMPFTYIYQLGDIRTAMFSASSTASTSVGVSIPWFNNATTTFTFLSASMISSVPFAGTFKTIIAFALWIMLAEFIYYRVLRTHDSHTPT